MNVYSELWALLRPETEERPCGLFGTVTAVDPLTVTVGGTAVTEGLYYPKGTRFYEEDIGTDVALLMCEEGFWILGRIGGGT